MNPKISVITATRNRENTLNRVFDSLKKQTFKNFEWIVCDDASNDNSLKLLRKFKKNANFKMRIFYFKQRAGKPKIDNYCVKKALGKFIIFADSDDSFKKNSLLDFNNEWTKIPSEDEKKIFAIVSRVTTPSGKPLEKKLNFKEKSISLIDLWNKYEKKKEKWLFLKKSILLKYKFPEIDYYVPEGIIWEKISINYNVWILDKCYRIFYNDTANSVTHSKKIKYTLGQFKSYEMWMLRYYNHHKTFRNIKIIINYYRYMFINKFFFKKKINDKYKTKVTYNQIYKVIAYIMFLKDVIFLNIENENFKKNNSKPIEILK